MWNHECLTAVEKRRVEFVPFDFFKEGPVKDQDIYYVGLSLYYSTFTTLLTCVKIRHVVHNWSDSVATNILKKVRDSMKPSSRLLIRKPDILFQCSHRWYFLGQTSTFFWDCISSICLIQRIGWIGSLSVWFVALNSNRSFLIVLTSRIRHQNLYFQILAQEIFAVCLKLTTFTTSL